MKLPRPLTPKEQEEVVTRLLQLTEACKQLEDPSIDWIRPESEVDEQVITDIQYHRVLASPLLKRIGCLEWP